MGTTLQDVSRRIGLEFNETVLIGILRTKSKYQTVKIKNVELSPYSASGDSYLSVITKFTVDATAEDGSTEEKDFRINVIVKSIPDSIARAKSFRSLDFFTTEIAFYTKVWPLLDAFQKSKQLSQLYDPIPQCLATHLGGGRGFIALEDISYQGFKALDRTSDGLELDTTLFVLNNFAKFHALGIAYREQNPVEFQQIEKDLQETYFDEKFSNWYEGTLAKFSNVIRDAVEKELPPEYLVKIEQIISQNLFGMVCAALAKRSVLTAVTHGDCWPPNFLVRDRNDSKELALIDFQLTRVSSSVTDLLFILYTCVNPAVLTEHWELLLKEYHKLLSGNLKDLGSKLDISFDVLMKDIKDCGIFAFVMCNEALIMSMMDADDVVDLDEIQGDTAIPLHHIWKIEPKKIPEKRKRLAVYVKHLIDHQLLE